MIHFAAQTEPQDEEVLSELCKGCTNNCSVCMVWKEHEGIPID